MNSFPEELPCNMCPRGRMFKSRVTEWHQYYLCNNIGCKNVTGLPFTQIEEKESNTDFGSGSFKSNRNDND